MDHVCVLACQGLSDKSIAHVAPFAKRAQHRAFKPTAQQEKLLMGAMPATSSDDVCLRPHNAMQAINTHNVCLRPHTAMQAISSDDICLRPHTAMPARTPSRGDSAADATLDQVIAPVLKKQQAVPETMAW